MFKNRKFFSRKIIKRLVKVSSSIDFLFFQQIIIRKKHCGREIVSLFHFDVKTSRKTLIILFQRIYKAETSRSIKLSRDKQRCYNQASA